MVATAFAGSLSAGSCRPMSFLLFVDHDPDLCSPDWRSRRRGGCLAPCACARGRVHDGAPARAGARARALRREGQAARARRGRVRGQLQGPVLRGAALEQHGVPRARAHAAGALPGQRAGRSRAAAEGGRGDRLADPRVAREGRRPDPHAGAGPHARVQHAVGAGALARRGPAGPAPRDRQPRDRPPLAERPRPLGRDAAEARRRDGRHARPLRLRRADDDDLRRRPAPAGHDREAAGRPQRGRRRQGPAQRVPRGARGAGRGHAPGEARATTHARCATTSAS